MSFFVILHAITNKTSQAMKKIHILPILVLTILASCNNAAKQPAGTETQTTTTDTSNVTPAKAEVYQCPMDCEKGKTYSQPGTCPVCGMDLKKV